MGGDELLIALIIVAGVLTFGIWSGAQLAVLVSSGGWLSADIGDAFSALLRLPANFGDPASAWPAPAGSSIPGAAIYWVSTLAVLLAELIVVAWAWVRLIALRVGTHHRERLGVAVGARLANRSDMDSLFVSGPTHGRFIFGRFDGQLIATEHPAAVRRSRRKRRRQRGRRSAVAVIGPSQSGKTATVVTGILDWEGPAILSSVKNDLFDETVARRLQLGEVFVFDPMRTIPELPEGVTRIGWSPLHAARTVPGAIEVSLALLDAAPTDGVTNANYWSSKGQALLWPILFAAAHDPQATMANVVRWLTSQDGNTDSTDEQPGAAAPRPEQFSEVRGILGHVGQSTNQAVAIQAGHALEQFDGFFRLDQRTRSDIYSTSQTLVQPWEDPNISYASSRAAGPVADLSLVLRGRNTLYVSTPLKDASRYAVVFGGLLGSLLRDQAYDVANRYRKPLPGLLCVIDEAGNTPLRWLPEVASTCSGIGVQLVTAWQSKAQIDATYQAQSGPMLTNHATKIFFAGASDVETLRYVTFLGGEEEVQQRSANADAHMGGYRRGVGDSTIHRPLLPAEVLRQAEPGNAILFHQTLPPAHIEGRYVGSDERLSALSAGSAEPPPGEAEDKAMLKALAFDPTPPLAVLEHLEAERVRLGPATEQSSPGEMGATVVPLGAHRRRTSIDR